MRTIALRGAAVCRPERIPRRRLRLAAGRMITRLRQWRRRSRGRSELARLDARTLADIGVTRAEAWAEIDKPFWRE